MRVLISGSSGFVGSAIVSHLAQNQCECVPLVRRPGAGILWDPLNQRVDRSLLEGFDAVIHLSGESIVGLWSEQKKNRIYQSRVESTRFLSECLSELSSPPRVFLSASAGGYFGNRGEEILTESSSAGKGFLPRVCAAWEEASRSLEDLGVRVVHTRFGVVLGNGGLVKRLRLPYLLGLGGKMGLGKQWVSWIALADLARGVEHVLRESNLSGPVNFVSPTPIRQEEFSKTMAALLHRPALLSLPSWALKSLFGQVAEEVLLCSARIAPEKLIHSGFQFELPYLEGALQKALG